jgi:hypothetical protein
VSKAQEAEKVADSPSAEIQAPYLPVLQALEKIIRDKIPLESSDYVKPIVKTKEIIDTKLGEIKKIETAAAVTKEIRTMTVEISEGNEIEAKSYPAIALEDEKYG